MCYNNEIKFNSTVDAQKTEKSIYKRWWFIVIALLFIFSIAGGALGDDTEPPSDNQADTQIVESPEEPQAYRNQAIVGLASIMVDLGRTE